MKASSPTPVLNHIRKPFFFLSARDDPFFGPEVIPIGHCFDQILIGITKTGGHCSHLEGRYLPTELWWTKPVFDFFDYFHSQPLEMGKMKKSDSASRLTELDSPKSAASNGLIQMQ
jgi:predicted alpha/beta-fold hydrolase